jgi:hypothetical protein
VQSADRRSLISFDDTGHIKAVLGGGLPPKFAIIGDVLAGNGGQLLVYDISKGALITIDSNFRVAGEIPFRYSPAFVVPPSGYLVASSIRTPAHVGQPLHVLGKDGAVLRSFGTDDETYREDEPMKYNRVVARGSAGTVWSVAPGRYLLEQWDPATGSRKQQVSVTSAWFKESNRLPASGQRPQPIIQAIWEDAGLMWVLLRDADLKWRPSAAAASDGPVNDDEFEATYDSVLEAVDLNTKKVVASRRFDNLLTTHSPSALVTTRRKVSNGLNLDVWKARLSTTKGSEDVWREQ